MRYRCTKDSFTEEEYQKYRESFYPMPALWVDKTNNEPMLSRLWRHGGGGPISLLPILGQFAHASFSHQVTLPKEKLARLAGIDAGTVAKAAPVLDKLGLASASMASYHGKRVTQWNLKPGIAVHRSKGGLDPNYFYFPSTLVYGGQWAQLTKVQRAILLAVGGSARHITDWSKMNSFLSAVLPKAVTRFDLESSFEHGLEGVRLVTLSYADLARITGVTVSALKVGVGALKHPDIWQGSSNDPAALRYNPVGVYPTFEGYSLLYHVRDHAQHWPWEQLNAGSALKTANA